MVSFLSIYFDTFLFTLAKMRYIVIFREDHEVVEVPSDAVSPGEFQTWSLEMWENHKEVVHTNVSYGDAFYCAAILQVPIGLL